MNEATLFKQAADQKVIEISTTEYAKVADKIEVQKVNNQLVRYKLKKNEMVNTSVFRKRQGLILETSSDRLFILPPLQRKENEYAEKDWTSLEPILLSVLTGRPDHLITSDLIENILDQKKGHPKHGARFVAASLDFKEYFESGTGNLTEEIDGDTPFSYSLKTRSFDSARVLLRNKKVVKMLDSKGNSIIHHAAMLKNHADSVLAVKMIADSISVDPFSIGKRKNYVSKYMNKPNKEGMSGFHICCKLGNLEACMELINLYQTSSRSDTAPLKVSTLFFDITNKITGDTCLHYAIAFGSLLQKLLWWGFTPKPNNAGLPPLHFAVLEHKFEPVMQFLIEGTNPEENATFDRYVEVKPFHLATLSANLQIMSALVAFDVDINAKDGDGSTAQHLLTTTFSGDKKSKQAAASLLLSLEAERCVNGKKGCSEDCCFTTIDDLEIKDDKVHFEELVTSGMDEMLKELQYNIAFKKEDGPKEEAGANILSLDGGGIRGLILTKMLCYIEKIYLTREGSKKSLIEEFDILAGTSTGGILALAFAKGITPIKTQKFYFQMKERVFAGALPYDQDHLIGFLKDTFGPETKMSDLKKRVMVMVTHVHDPLELNIIRSYPTPYLKPAKNPSDQMYVWEAAAATSLANVFDIKGGDHFDGGLMANNPTMAAWNELISIRTAKIREGRKEYFHWKAPSFILSLGTGIMPENEATAKMLNIHPPKSLCDGLGVLTKLPKAANLLIRQLTQSNGECVSQANGMATVLGIPFFRMSPKLSDEVSLTATNNAIIVKFLVDAAKYLVQNKKKISKICDELIKCRNEVENRPQSASMAPSV